MAQGRGGRRRRTSPFAFSYCRRTKEAAGPLLSQPPSHSIEERVESDIELVRECLRGSSRAWESLVQRHQDRMLNLAYQFTGNREEARDLAQDIFVHLYHKLDRFDSARPFSIWLNSLARNLCIDAYRRRKQRPSAHARPVEEWRELAAAVPSPARRVEQRSESEFLARAMDELGEISREAIVLKDLQGHSIEEIATILGIATGTVKSRIFRARLELAEAVVRLRQATTGGGLEL